MWAICWLVSQPSRPGTENFWFIALVALLTVAIPTIVSTSQIATTRRRWRSIQRVKLSIAKGCTTNDWHFVEWLLRDDWRGPPAGCSVRVHRLPDELGREPIAAAVRAGARGALRHPPARVRRAEHDRRQPGHHPARDRRGRRRGPEHYGRTARSP